VTLDRLGGELPRVANLCSRGGGRPERGRIRIEPQDEATAALLDERREPVGEMPSLLSPGRS
jgi:hypothetical protein